MKLKLLAVACLMTMGIGAQENKTMKAYMVSDAHLDTQWNWDVQTTIKTHIWNTMVQNFHLFNEYPNYVFNFEGAVKYAWMKEYYPAQYEELKKWIDKGRWHITGSSWDANEVIVCSPESWIRNIALGQTFYRQEFGKEGTDVFLPDCFGFPYTLPTLANHCGLIGFSSQKLVWRNKPFYEGNKRYPFTVGLWRGIDGSQVMMAHGFGYGQRYNDEDLSRSEQLKKEIGESPLGIVYRYYGTGDIGGSPTVGSVRSVEKGIKGDGPIQVISATSDQLYKDFLPYDQHPELPTFDGELTMDLHGNACYTSQAAMKLYNRQNEHLGDAAERAAVMADWAGAYSYPIGQMTAAWQRVIWHQFHDDLTGTSIPRAYEFSWNDELISLKQFSNVLTTSVSGMAQRLNTQVKGTPLVVYNNESFPVKSIVTIATDVKGDNYVVTEPNGKVVPSQVVETNGQRQLLFEAEAPGVGMAVYSLKEGGKKAGSATLDAREIENAVYKLRVDDRGDIVSLYDKIAHRELVADGRSIRLVVFDDCRSEAWPAWEIHKRTLDKEPIPFGGQAKISVEVGPLCKSLTIEKKHGATTIQQTIRLYEGAEARRIDLINAVDWQEENALLKVEFPLTVSNAEATYDLGLGSVRRGNNCDNQYEVYSHEWTDLTDRTGLYGVTILNNARYGWDKPNDNTLRLSLLYAPQPRRGYVYQAHQDKGFHRFTYSIIGHQGTLNEPETVRKATILNSPLRAFTVPKHKGNDSQFSFVSSNNDNVIIRTLKRAEVSNEYVVRVYELSGKSEQNARLTFAADIVKAVEADGTERTLHNASFSGHDLNVTIKPYSVKTYKVQLQQDEAPAKAAMATMVLPYNQQCATFNAFRSDADFESGYSYAAELLPADNRLCVDGVDFLLGERDARNGLRCNGDTLQLPADRPYNHLYLLAASSKDDRMATFRMGKSEQTVEVPFYAGFVGQWGHDGQTDGHLKQAEVAYVGTHRHSAGQDEPYEYTYMFKLCLDIPRGATQLVLPKDANVVLFAATAVNDGESVCPATKLFETSNRNDLSYRRSNEDALSAVPSVLQGAAVIDYTGFVNNDERPELLIDGNPITKWCDTSSLPNYVTFDLGSERTVSRWHILNAGSETAAYITRTCLLQGRRTAQEEWRTLDILDGNRANEIDRTFTPATVRYVRLYVISPTQSIGMDATRIYEFDLY